MTAALDVLARLDDGLPISTADRNVLDVFDEHCRWGAQRFCLICGVEGQGPECDTCTARHDQAVERSGDL